MLPTIPTTTPMTAATRRADRAGNLHASERDFAVAREHDAVGEERQGLQQRGEHGRTGQTQDLGYRRRRARRSVARSHAREHASDRPATYNLGVSRLRLAVLRLLRLNASPHGIALGF